MPQAIDFLLARFNGTAAPSGCDTQTFTTPRVPSADALGQNVTTLFGAVLSSYKITNSTASSSTASGASSASASAPAASATGSAAISAASATSTA